MGLNEKLWSYIVYQQIIIFKQMEGFNEMQQGSYAVWGNFQYNYLFPLCLFISVNKAVL